MRNTKNIKEHINRFVNNRSLSLLFIFVIGIILLGGTYSYWAWESDELSRTAVSFTATSGLSCSADGGGDITVGSTSLVPASCTNSEHVIRRVITTRVNNTGTSATSLSMWLNVNTLGSYLANNSDFKYTISTSDSCTSDIIASGDFGDVTVGSTLSLVDEEEYSDSRETGTYYLYMWLDKSETTIPPDDLESRTMNLTLGGTCSEKEIPIPPAVSYTSSGSYTYTVPVTGNYHLEVWGAQGGGSKGGYGGYSTGVVNLTAGTTLYVYVGGTTSSATAGYNGGGTAGSSSGYGGGGATHIAKTSGLLKNVSASDVYIVAGGGGGADNWSSGALGGHAGGYQGVAGSWTGSTSMTWSIGGSQTSGGVCQTSGATYSSGSGSFGQGGNGATWGGAGGGGYYGGAGGNAASDWVSAGGGGSGYIGNSLLTNKVMYCYNCSPSDSVSHLTYSTNSVSSTPTSNCAKSGSGAATISYVEGSYVGPQIGVSGYLSPYYQYNAYYESTYGGMDISPHYVEQYYENGNYSVIMIDHINLTSSMYSQSVAWSVDYGVTIDGTQYSCSGTAYTSNYTATSWPCTIVSDPIYHNSDGSKSITIALTSAHTASDQVGAVWGPDYGTLTSANVTLTKINR